MIYQIAAPESVNTSTPWNAVYTKI